MSNRQTQSRSAARGLRLQGARRRGRGSQASPGIGREWREGGATLSQCFCPDGDLLLRGLRQAWRTRGVMVIGSGDSGGRWGWGGGLGRVGGGDPFIQGLRIT